MKLYRGVMRTCGVLAALLIGVIVVLVCYDVIGRNLGLKSLPWIVEVTEYALPLITLLAAPWLLFRAEHVRLDLLNNILPPAPLRALDRITSGIALAVCLMIVWYSLKVIADTREIGAMVMKSLVFPEWWLFVPVSLSFGLMAIECGRRLLHPGPHAAVSSGSLHQGE
jgi:TRAP-type C4-dicarboxylate transport system permease small subunit